MSTPINDGGPAFPRHPVNFIDKDGPAVVYGSDGMSLRDWLAGQALNGWLASCDNNTPKHFFEPAHVAKTSYDYADAMLKARNQKGDSE